MSHDLVFRRVPPGRRDVARRFVPVPGDPDATWWELVDVAAASAGPPAAVALTRTGDDGVVRVVGLHGAPVGRLVRELVAALRRTDAVAVEIADAPGVLEGLSCEQAERVGDHLVVPL